MPVKRATDSHGKPMTDRDGLPVYEVRLVIRRRYHGQHRAAVALERRLRDAVSLTGAPDRVTILDLLPQRIDYHRANGHSDSHQANCRRTLQRMARELPICIAATGGAVDPEAKDIALQDITLQALEEWQRRRAKEVLPATVNRDVGVLVAMAKWAIRTRRWQPVDGAGVSVPSALLYDIVAWLHVDKLHEHGRSVRQVPNAVELLRILNQMPMELRLPLIALVLLADRPGAIVAMRWSHVHRPAWVEGAGGARQIEGRVDLLDRKGGFDRCIIRDHQSLLWPALDEARELFKRHCGRPPRCFDYVFLNSRGNPWTVKALYAALRRNLARVGMPLMPTYSIRHAVGTIAAAMGASEVELQRLLGHETRDTSRHYIHDLADATQAAIGRRVEGNLQQAMARLIS